MPADPARAGVVVAGHGAMAPGLASAVELIAGPQEGFEAVSLPEDASPDGFEEILRAAVDRVDAGAGTLVLADLPGATPFNAAARLAHGGASVEVVGGVSLPMLLEVLLGRDGVAVGALAEVAVRAGAAGVVHWSAARVR